MILQGVVSWRDRARVQKTVSSIALLGQRVLSQTCNLGVPYKVALDSHSQPHRLVGWRWEPAPKDGTSRLVQDRVAEIDPSLPDPTLPAPSPGLDNWLQTADGTLLEASPPSRSFAIELPVGGTGSRSAWTIRLDPTGQVVVILGAGAAS
jgi:hypothetical protein